MRHQKIVLALLFQAAAMLTTAQTARTIRHLPDTGQKNSYTATPGEDSDYSIFPPFFAIENSGIAIDTVTGLMWQRVDGGEMTVENAAQYCDTLTLGGYTDWRLPDALESFSILYHDKPNPALDAAVFAATGAEYWWTSEHQANDANKIWVTNAGGGIGNHLKTETISAGGAKRFHVRAVRALTLPVPLAANFLLNSDNAATDQRTDLMWQRSALPDSMTWEQALLYAENLDLAGFSDWRLPNIKELRSLSDEAFVNPSVDPAVFQGIGVRKYWSSTSLPNQTTKGWYLDTRFGITTYEFKTRKLNVICVRGPVSATSPTAEVIAAEQHYQVGPNPFSDYIRVYPAALPLHTVLYNSVGQVVYSGMDIGTVDLSGLARGVYVLEILGEWREVVRVVKY